MTTIERIPDGTILRATRGTHGQWRYENGQWLFCRPDGSVYWPNTNPNLLMGDIAGFIIDRRERMGDEIEVFYPGSKSMATEHYPQVGDIVDRDGDRATVIAVSQHHESLKRYGGIWVTADGEWAERVDIEDVTLLLNVNEAKPYPNVERGWDKTGTRPQDSAITRP